MRWADSSACPGLLLLLLDDKFRDEKRVQASTDHGFESSMSSTAPANSRGLKRTATDESDLPVLLPGHLWVLAEPCGTMPVGSVVRPEVGSRGLGRRCVARLGRHVAFCEMVSCQDQLTYADRRIEDVQQWACSEGSLSTSRSWSHDVRRRPALPSHLYRDGIAPFLSFTTPLPNMLYVLGGRNMHDGPLSSVEMFDTWFGRWVPCPPMPTRRAGSTAAALPSGHVMVIGGYDERGTELGVLASSDIYDPIRKKWLEASAAPLKRARWGHGCGMLRGTVFVVGGCSRQAILSAQPTASAWGQGMETLGSTERWFPEEDVWLPCASLHTPRAGVRVTSLKDRYLIAAGGNEDVFGSNINLDSVELYDIELNMWQLLSAPLSIPRATAGVAAIDDDRVLIVGGSRDRAEVDSSAEIYDAMKAHSSCESGSVRVESMETIEVPGLSEGRMGTQAAQLLLPKPGGLYPATTKRCVAIVGGECLGSLFSRQLASVPIFDIEKMAWRTDSIIPPMSTPRTAAAVCVSIGHAGISQSI